MENAELSELSGAHVGAGPSFQALDPLTMQTPWEARLLAVFSFSCCCRKWKLRLWQPEIGDLDSLRVCPPRPW